MRMFYLAAFVLLPLAVFAADGGMVVEDSGSDTDVPNETGIPGSGTQDTGAWYISPTYSPETSGSDADWHILDVVPHATYEGATPDDWDQTFNCYPKRAYFKDGAGSWTSNYCIAKTHYKVSKYDYGNSSWSGWSQNWTLLDTTYNSLGGMPPVEGPRGPFDSSDREVDDEGTNLSPGASVSVAPAYSSSEVAGGRPIAKIVIRAGLYRDPSDSPESTFNNTTNENGAGEVFFYYFLKYEAGSM